MVALAARHAIPLFCSFALLPNAYIRSNATNKAADPRRLLPDELEDSEARLVGYDDLAIEESRSRGKRPYSLGSQ